MAQDTLARILALSASGGGGGEPDEYLKSASVSGNTLTLKDKENNTIEFEPEVPTYTAGDGIEINNNEISIDNTVALKSEIPDVSDFATETYVDNAVATKQDTLTAGEGIDITNNVISAEFAPPVWSVNDKTGAVVLNAGDILATNTQSVQANLERIDTEVEGVIDDVADLETEVAGKQDTLTAGSNISISGTTISATDTTYTASTGINISAANAISYTGTVLYATFDSSTGTLSLSTTA